MLRPLPKPLPYNFVWIGYKKAIASDAAQESATLTNSRLHLVLRSFTCPTCIGIAIVVDTVEHWRWPCLLRQPDADNTREVNATDCTIDKSPKRYAPPNRLDLWSRANYVIPTPSLHTSISSSTASGSPGTSPSSSTSWRVEWQGHQSGPQGWGWARCPVLVEFPGRPNHKE